MTNQEYWFDLRERLGDDRARKLVVDKLKQAIILIENNDFPDIFGCRLQSEHADWCKSHFLETLTITLSNPWPG